MERKATPGRSRRDPWLTDKGVEDAETRRRSKPIVNRRDRREEWGFEPSSEFERKNEILRHWQCRVPQRVLRSIPYIFLRFFCALCVFCGDLLIQFSSDSFASFALSAV
jgi:hypothetical protein